MSTSAVLRTGQPTGSAAGAAREEPARPPAVELNHVVVVRAGHVVLEVPRLVVERGETVAVIGPNGAGKSTLLQVMACLLRPSSGSVRVGGEEVRAGPGLLSLRRRMAMVLQRPHLLDTTVFENVAVGLRVRGLSRAEVHRRVCRAADLFGVGHLASRRARELSAGESQRVSLARAFVLEPEVLFLDEPFGSLDAVAKAALLGELGEVIRRTATTTVFATHDVTEIPFLARRTVVMNRGRVAADGDVRQVLDGAVRSALSGLVRSVGWLSGTDGGL